MSEILIQRHPSALLETLGAKSGGQTPVQTDENLKLVLDASEFYAQASAEVLLASVSAAALGFNGTSALRVPAGELWRVRSVSVFSAALGAGQTLDLQPSMQLVGTSTLLVGTTSDAATVGIALSVGWDFRTPRIFPPGWQAGCFVRNLVAGPVNVQVAVDFDRLR